MVHACEQNACHCVGTLLMLDELVSAGVVPNIVTYNTMMNGVCNDILDRAWSWQQICLKV